MPLASDRSASLHREKQVEAAKKEEARRRRLSLPRSIRSSTRVDVTNAERRRSRRLSERLSFSSSSKENANNANVPGSPRQGPTPYHKVVAERGGEQSPRLTRSNKKEKQKNGNKIPRGSGVILSFSPPNQELNEQREKERIEMAESVRSRRVQSAKENGQLLVFSPSNRPLCLDDGDDDSECTRPSEERGVEMDVESQATSALSDSNHTNNFMNEQLASDVKGIKEQMQAFFESNAASKNAVQQSEIEKQQLAVTMLMENNKKLEEKCERVEQELIELSKTTAEEKNELIVEATRLRSQLDSATSDSSSRLDILSSEREKIEDKLTELQNEKIDLVKQIAELQQLISVGKDKFDQSNSMLEALKEQNEEEKESLQNDVENLQEVNKELSIEMSAIKEERNQLDVKIATYEQQVSNFTESVIPGLEGQRDQALSKLEQQQEIIESLESQLASLENEKSELHTQICAVRAASEEQRLSYERLGQESGQATEFLQQEMEKKSVKIGELEGSMKQLRESLDKEQAQNAELKESMDNLKEDFESRVQELDDSLESTMTKLQASEDSKQNLEQKLEEALADVEAAKASAHSAATQNSETSSELQELREALAAEREKLETEREKSKHEQEKAAAAVDRAETLEQEARQLEIESRGFEKELKITLKERDDARSNMEGFDNREEELYRRLRESDRIRRDLHGKVMQLMGNIRVFVRVRPPLPGELEASMQNEPVDQKKRKRGEPKPESTLFRFPGVYDRVDKKSSPDDATKNLIEVTEPFKDRGGLSDRRKKWKFGFDSIFSPEHGQDDIWEATEPLIQCAVDGYNVTLFAYGQTGSGKTFTMLGVPGNEGIVSRAVKKLFETKAEIEALSKGTSKVELSVELLEVYNEQVRDLLAPDSGPNGRELPLKVTSQEVVGNIVVNTGSQTEVMEVLEMAQKRRCVKATSSNSESSRSHMLFTIHFVVTTKDGSQRSGKLNVCDLAGSERLNKSGTHHVGGSLLRETKNINKSLSTLSNVIERLQAGDANVPFRESKLTFLLQNSLGGNSKTLAIVCCNPLPSHFHESLCSLRFAQKVSKVDLKQATANFSC